MRTVLAAAIGVACLMSAHQVEAQSVRDIRGAPAAVPLENEPPPRLFVDPPVAEALAMGRVFIQYRAENLRIVQVFGTAALGVTPRIGHIHVTVDDTPWHWADASGEQIIITGLPVGPHRVLIELVNAAHQTVDQVTIEFVVPVLGVPAGHAPPFPE